MLHVCFVPVSRHLFSSEVDLRVLRTEQKQNLRPSSLQDSLTIPLGTFLSRHSKIIPAYEHDPFGQPP